MSLPVVTGSWTCLQCQYTNATGNVRCGGNSLSGCGAVSPHHSVVTQTAETPSTGMSSSSRKPDGSSREDGSWTCPKCGNHNFAARASCNMRICNAVGWIRLPPHYFPLQDSHVSVPWWACAAETWPGATYTNPDWELELLKLW